MTHASKTYRGTEKPKKEKRGKECEAKVILDDIIGYSKALCHVATKCDKKEVSRMSKIAEKLQEIHDAYFESDEESTDNETEDSD